MDFPYHSTQPGESDEDRRARGRALIKDLSREAVALKADDPTLFSLMEIKIRALNRLYGLGTKTEGQKGSIAALEDMVGVIDEEIARVGDTRLSAS